MPEDTLQGTGDKSTVYHHYSVLLIIRTRFHILLTVHARKVTCSHYTHSVPLCMQRQGEDGGDCRDVSRPGETWRVLYSCSGQHCYPTIMLSRNINVKCQHSKEGCRAWYLFPVTSPVCDLRKRWVTSYPALISVTV